MVLVRTRVQFPASPLVRVFVGRSAWGARTTLNAIRATPYASRRKTCPKHLSSLY